jgi:hypothetical protein
MTPSDPAAPRRGVSYSDFDICLDLARHTDVSVGEHSFLAVLQLARRSCACVNVCSCFSNFITPARAAGSILRRRGFTCETLSTPNVRMMRRVFVKQPARRKGATKDKVHSAVLGNLD